MKQISFASIEQAGKRRVTRRQQFLQEMDRVVPWARLVSLIEPHYPKGHVGRPPIGVERMLRLYFVQQWFGLSDLAVEDAVIDSVAVRDFVGIDLGREQAPDSTTVLKFRRLLEKHSLTQAIFEEVKQLLSERGQLLREGTLVDATIIAAPPSTKNREGQRDPDMHQTKKGNQWHFGMKVHIGADAESGLVHSLHTTAANESDVAHAHRLLHGQERAAHADAGYVGVAKRAEVLEAQAEGLIRQDVQWHVAPKKSKLAKLPPGAHKSLLERIVKLQASIRARVEHPFHVVKNLFRHRKTRYRGLAKNTAQMHTLFALANLVIGKAGIMAASTPGSSPS